MSKSVKFINISQETYDNLQEKSPYYHYLTNDTNNYYLGELQLNNVDVIIGSESFSINADGWSNDKIYYYLIKDKFFTDKAIFTIGIDSTNITEENFMEVAIALIQPFGEVEQTTEGTWIGIKCFGELPTDIIYLTISYVDIKE